MPGSARRGAQPAEWRSSCPCDALVASAPGRSVARAVVVPCARSG